MTNQKALITKQTFIDTLIKNNITNQFFKITFIRHLLSQCIARFENKLTDETFEGILDVEITSAYLYVRLHIKSKVFALLADGKVTYQTVISTNGSYFIDILKYQLISIEDNVVDR